MENKQLTSVGARILGIFFGEDLSGHTLEDLVCLTNFVEGLIGSDFGAVQFQEHFNEGQFVVAEFLPEYAVRALSHNCSHARVDLKMATGSYRVLFGHPDDLGTWVTVSVQSLYCSGYDQGIMLCRWPTKMSRFFPFGSCKVTHSRVVL